MEGSEFQTWLVDKITNIESTLTKQQTILEEHQRRSLANEDAVALMRADLEPIKTHVAVVGAIAKAGTVLIGLAGTVVGVLKALSIF